MITKLEAVNRMLKAINERPVSALNSGVPDAESAVSALDEVTKDVLAKGWQCNTDYNFRFVPNPDGLIVLPDTAYRIDATGQSAALSIAVRRYNGHACIYNVDKQTYLWTGPVWADVVWEMAFEDLTHELQAFITYKAARRFQKGSVQSVAIDKLLKELEDEAWAALQDAEGETENCNVLRDCKSVRLITQRNSRIWGI